MSTPLTRRSVLATCAVVGLAGCSRRVEQSHGSRSAGGRRDPRRTLVRRAGRSPTPVRLAIPGIGVDTRLVRLGLNDDGTVEVPTVPETAGWFDLGTVPGRRGSAVILGHVDSVDGPAVFADLSTLRSADRVQVVLSDGGIVAFEVTGSRRTPTPTSPPSASTPAPAEPARSTS